jgi:RNA:NAD 2'-phosphotransferase (TPT1/KptA family)
MDGCGFVPASKLAQSMETTDNADEIVRVAQRDEKGRYQLDDSNGDDLRVRATQGHSIKLENPLLDAIKGPEEVPLALHATSEEGWERIQRSGQLKRMNRTVRGPYTLAPCYALVVKHVWLYELLIGTVAAHTFCR